MTKRKIFELILSTINKLYIKLIFWSATICQEWRLIILNNISCQTNDQIQKLLSYIYYIIINILKYVQTLILVSFKSSKLWESSIF